MKTGPLLKSSWLLAGDSVSVLVNTSKPSIRGLFAFGRMGRMHNLLYDLDCIALYSDLYGIYPYCEIGGITLYPFRSGVDVRSADSFDISGDKTVSVSETGNRITFLSVPLFEKGEVRPCAVMESFGVSLDGGRLSVEAVFQEGAVKCGIHLPWYPIYDSFSADHGEKKKIQYYRHGIYGIFEDHRTENIKGSVLLSDTLSRQASVEITPGAGEIMLRGCTKKEYGNALYLSTDVVADGSRAGAVIEVIPPASAVSGAHYYPCGADAELTVTGKNGSEKLSLRIPETRGLRRLDVGDGEFDLCAVPDDREMMKKAADACREIFWKEGGLRGVPPYAFDPTTLDPQLRSGMRYCSHGMRAISCLCAEAVRSGDISYADAAYAAFRRVEAVSYRGGDGSVFTPLIMDDDGDPGIYADSCRPSDIGIIIRGLIHTAKAYLHFGDDEKARACAVLASDYSKTISKMQNGDGSFFDRYHYPTAEPSVKNKGTVNNWCLQLWRLIPLLRRFGMDEDAQRLDSLIDRYIGYQIGKENGILYISGGGEDASDFGDALNTDATLFAIRYLKTGDPVWKDYAEQALKKSWLMSCMWADMPQFFG
ncbi:MAG: hypothetical protein K6D94_07475, partial [Clostridiales bacterium]|nr:hypothetical protein [Clostridiales bacterium]